MEHPDDRRDARMPSLFRRKKMMRLPQNFLVTLVIVIVIGLATLSEALSIREDLPENVNLINNNSSTIVKNGRCPDPRMGQRLCTGQPDQCSDNAQCSGESLCCSTGCNRVCVMPVYTACEHVRSSAERRARALSDKEDQEMVPVPQCDPSTGSFKEVQCDKQKGCYCVDNQGFEVPGTRARSLKAVNCSNPDPKCEGPMCRMLCPHGFELDPDGCEICECRDVCKGVKCPGSLTCEVEEVPSCKEGSCPPLPSCKEGRSLSSFCAFGAPLTIPESGAPFLCGKSEGQPPCPAAFECVVQSGNEYGVCCAENRNFDKPGSCPVIAGTENGKGGRCDKSCRHDLDCADFQKCCFSEGCGKQCAKPSNSTVCLQQRHIAELLSAKEREGKGYIPQCDENGSFVPKQCSRNGKICWCVSEDGKNFPQSLGPSSTVDCSKSASSSRRSAIRSNSNSSPCDTVICPPSLQCKFGFKQDRNGCPSCDCAESPCTLFPCPSGSQCHLDPETIRPTCLSDSLFVNPCPMGTPLTVGAEVVACSGSAPTCPSSHICVVVAPNKAGLCCPNQPKVEPTKPGMCPFLENSLCSGKGNDTVLRKCGSDSECENSMKCCAAGDCTICADPLLPLENAEKRDGINGKTMCQYIQSAGKVQTGIFAQLKLGRPIPSCKPSGQFEEVQCDEENCYCVDEYGLEVPGTLVKKSLAGNLTAESCYKARENPEPCFDINCRLACDYGYEVLDGCRICECRNPCLQRNSCGEDEICEMADIGCEEEHCPPLPFCVPKLIAELSTLASEGKFPPSGGFCPQGTPFQSEGNETLFCNPRARMLQCPEDFFCHDMVVQGHEFGICCPIVENHGNSIHLKAENRQSPIGEMEDLDLDNLLGVEVVDTLQGSSVNEKAGQCPYLPFHITGKCSQRTECDTDPNCPGERKCCRNSCGGSTCMAPLFMTACQHQQSVLQHLAREMGTPLKRVFIPECSQDGAFSRIQTFEGYKWCVDSAGEEIPGTRASNQEEELDCFKPRTCPQRKCSLSCDFGYALDSDGCQECACRPSPCSLVSCQSGEECRMTRVDCISDTCPPVPLCLPRLDNPCPNGGPLTFEETGERVSCSKGSRGCPSSHFCLSSPFQGEPSVCCPKPKDVCFLAKEEGECRGIMRKWFFNTTANECQPFLFSGCGENENNFNSKAECLSVCPSLTHCERIREKNLEARGKFKHMTYIPSCDSKNGDWDKVQCFQEVGMCWCVNKKGEPVKGTMTSGVPNCEGSSGRRGRMLASAASSVSVTAVCPPSETVHQCDAATVCEGKICLAAPTAKCMVNPCGGCKTKWVSETGEEVNCNQGLGSCQKYMQEVMNSPSWINQGFKTEEIEDFQILEAPPRPQMPETKTMTKVTPIFADFGTGGKVMGVMSTSVTVMGRQGNNNQEQRLPNSPVRSIADILSDLVSSQTQSSPVRRGYLSDDLIDLMPSASSSEMLPPFPHVPDFPFFPQGFQRPPSSHSSRVRRAASPSSSSDASPSSEDYFEDSLAIESSEIPISVRAPDSLAVESLRIPRLILPKPEEILVSILPQHKPGACPSKGAHPFALLSILTGSCEEDSDSQEDECRADHECSGELKCCPGGRCGFRLSCQQPEYHQINIGNLPFLFGNDQSMMQYQPQSSYEDMMMMSPPTMVSSIPECEASGDFSPTQGQGDFSWCVSPEDGTPTPGTITRGKVICARNGTLLKRWAKGPVCHDPEATPRVCRDECLHASCPLHPDAVCVMDICDGCTPSFYKPSGEKVQCAPKCLQPSFEAGICRASIQKYSFNLTSGRCEPFIYGGCQGNDNNFETALECEEECGAKERSGLNDICSLPPKPGPCRASMSRYHFNPNTHQCEEFDYGGCGGNANNFFSKEHCEARCPDVILCPKISEEEINMKACSRVAACRNATCPGYQVDDFLCHVDPCSCTAQLKDFQGKDVDCSTLPPPSPPQQSSEGSDADIIEISPPSFGTSSNQVLQILPGYSIPPYSRCELMRSMEPSVSCDSLSGGFASLQCIPGNPECVCVDEAGKEVKKTMERFCPPVPIARVLVQLSFPLSEDLDMSSVQLGVEMQDLLRSLGAEIQDDKVEVEVLPGATRLNFVLKGDNKVKTSFLLEELVIANAIGVKDQKDKFHPADFATSMFIHERDVVEPSSTESTSTTTTEETTAETETPEIFISEDILISENEIPEEKLRKEFISAEILSSSESDEKLGMLLTFVAALSALLLVFAMFLALQKRKNSMGSYETKKPFDLAFSSNIYEIEKKKTIKERIGIIKIPTFKVLPISSKESHQEKEKEATST